MQYVAYSLLLLLSSLFHLVTLQYVAHSLLLLLYDMYVSCHRHFFLVLLLNQR